MARRRRSLKGKGWASLWRRNLECPDQRGSDDPSKNVLVISDMHLGEDCKPVRNLSSLRRLLQMEANLVSFLDHHRSHRAKDQQPWRLVINGDMIDFPHVHLASDVDEGHPDLRRFGRGTKPAEAVEKLDRVVGRHPAFFGALGRFVQDGHYVDIVSGNHDVELQWPCVQAAFRLHLACQSGTVISSWDDADSRVRFHDWFYLEPGQIYVEHGHQYDPTSSWEYFLAPQTSSQQKEIVLNLSSASIRYFANLEPAMDPHGQHRWTPLGYVRWALREGPSGACRILLRYLGLASRLIGLWRVHVGVHRDAMLKKIQGERLAALARKVRVDVETLRAVDGLRQTPVTWSLPGVAQVLYLDRISVWFVAVSVVIGLPSTGLVEWTWGLLVVLPLVLVLDYRLSRKRNLNSSRGLRSAAGRIRALLEVPIVTFGHTHDAQQVELEGGWYFNTGTWLDGQSAGDGTPFTYLQVCRQEGAIDASLWRWDAAGPRAEGRGPVRLPHDSGGNSYIA